MSLMKTFAYNQDPGNIEEEKYQEIFTELLMSGEYLESDIDAQVMEIMDNPHIYPEYFR